MNGSDRCGRLASNLAAYVILTLFVTTAGAQLELPNGLPNCLERCEVTDPQLLRLARSTCALVGKDRMILNADGTYTMLTQSSNSALLLCSDSAWSGQPTYLSGRTGCLVGSDLVLSASHFIHPSDANFCANVWYFVFDYAIMNRGSGCELPSTTIPADLVYECAEIVRHGNFDGEADLILFRLDRPVTGDREPIAVRQSGEPLPGDPIACVHHPERLPQKIETAVTFESISPSIPTPTVIVNGINASFGSSGSPIYNLREDVIESVITGGGCLRSDFSGGCVRLRSACDQTTKIGRAHV